MKKLAIGLSCIIFILAILVCIVQYKTIIQRQSIMAREPLTVSDLDNLAHEWGVTGQEGHFLSTGVNSDEVAPKQLENRPSLKRTLTKAEKLSITEDKQNSIYDWAMLRFTESIATLYLSLGIDEGAGFYYYDTATVADSIGDWETARHFYRKALDYPIWPRIRQVSLVRLAWMEDDPLVADRLLGLALPEKVSTRALYDATDLAWRTGSDDLFENYLERLRVENPEIASQFDWRPKPSDAEYQVDE